MGREKGKWYYVADGGTGFLTSFTKDIKPGWLYYGPMHFSQAREMMVDMLNNKRENVRDQIKELRKSIQLLTSQMYEARRITQRSATERSVHADRQVPTETRQQAQA